jgi:hypothetical protein
MPSKTVSQRDGIRELASEEIAVVAGGYNGGTPTWSSVLRQATSIIFSFLFVPLRLSRRPQRVR